MEYPQPKPLQSFMDTYIEFKNDTGDPELRALYQQFITLAYRHHWSYGESLAGVEALSDYLRELQALSPVPALYERAINTLANPKEA